VPVPVEVGQLVAALNGFMARLSKAMDRVSGLVAEAAHEVRTPLASLRAQAEVAVDEQDPVALRRRVQRIHQGAVQASQLVSQLLMDATISHRLDSHEVEKLGLADVIEEVRHRLDPDHAGRVSLSATAAFAAAQVRGDRVSLREMVRNLIDNALVYSSGAVEIDGRVEGERVVVEVRDRGPGIPEADRARVLERFQRGAQSGGTVGSGLGLSIVRRVVDAHRGTLTLGDRPGGGLVVAVALPVLVRVGRRGASGLVLLVPLLLVAQLVPDRAGAASASYPAPAGEAEVLTIVGTTDTPLFAAFIEGFQALHPEVSVHYEEMDSLPLYRGFLDGTLPVAPDLLISSASDLQLKLANDGHALAHDSPFLATLPDWAHWRNEVFGFTFEPAVIIYNSDLLEPAEVPRTHLKLAELLETQSERFRGRVATYDISQSGVGYLLAAQDQTISSTFWRLATAFGRVGAEFSGSSPAILNGVAEGRLALGYNVLGSYAFARQAEGARIEIVVPDDYVLALTRSLLIPRDAAKPQLARDFVDFALSPAGQGVGAGASALGSVVPGMSGEWTSEAIVARGRGVIQPIALGPGLLVALDQLRRQRFLDTWQEIVSPAR
jgi:two-component system sensor histidine kinase TctE